ncbi:hypothetical protein Tsp_00105 [Trichinella spiralis]|uniref:hypothetical protein n=1 Tax=Trichinella spiralis TaxID=6334 RepID=UPI0001EFBE41|nr:hypothetical protein Tsp_00105 [Trichinella spiralis]
MQARYSCHSVTMVVVVVVVVSANNNNYGYGQRYGNDVTERANYFKAAHLKKQTKPPIGLQHQLTAPTRLNVNNCFFHNNNNNDDDDDDGDDNITVGCIIENALMDHIPLPTPPQKNIYT